MRIAVVGLGQIGGSIVLALRRNNAPVFITGIEPSLKRRRGLQASLDDAKKRWTNSIESDLIIVCTHYDETVGFLKQADSTRLILDVCSGKAKLVQIANHRKLRFIGGHPMAGNEFAGEKGWRENLFDEAPFFLCPGELSSMADLKTVKTFVKQIDARSIMVDPDLHDRFVATTSHFPALLAIFLRDMAKNIPAGFKGPGFQSMTRLANTPPELLNTFVKSNRSSMLASARQMADLIAKWQKQNAKTRG